MSAPVMASRVDADGDGDGNRDGVEGRVAGRGAAFLSHHSPPIVQSDWYE